MRATPNLPSARYWQTHAGLMLLLAACIGLGSVYAVTTPLFDASDEVWHYPMVRHIADTGNLPVLDPADPGPWRQEAGQPPLYYFLMAQATRFIDTSDMARVRWLNPHADVGILTTDGNRNLVVHTAAESWPWHGTALAVRVIRLLSVLLAAGTVWCTYEIGLAVLARDHWLAACAAGFVAFTPMFLFISGTVNNDNLAMLLASLIVLLLVRMATAPAAASVRQPAAHALLGLLLGLGALSKLSLLALFPVAAAVIGVLQIADWRSEPQRGAPGSMQRHALRLTRMLLLVFGIAALAAGWWFVRNLQLYGTPTGLNQFVAVLGVRSHPAGLQQLWSEREGFMRTFWGLFGGVNVPFPGWVYSMLNTFALVAGSGAFIFAGRMARRSALHSWLPLAVIIVAPLAVFVALLRWSTFTWSSQGRLMFTAIQSLAVLFAAGIAAWFPAPWRMARNVCLSVPVLAMLALSAAAPTWVIAPAYAAPAPADLTQMKQTVGTDFGTPPSMRLLGYTLGATQVQPGDDAELTLYWQVLAPMQRDWSVFVHLIDEAQTIVAQRDTFPGLGRQPTRLLQPGQLLADRYVLRVPQTACAPARLQVQVGLYDFATGERLLTDTGAEYALLAELPLLAAAGGVPNALAINLENQVQLSGYELGPRTLHAGDALRLTLQWRALRPPAANYTVFVQVRGTGDQVWGQHDGWPLDGNAPTAAWQPGQDYADAHTLQLAANTPPGTYSVQVGMYNDRDERLTVISAGGEWGDNFVTLCPIRVASPD